MKKAVYIQFGIISLSFFWTGTAFISVTYSLMDFFTSSQLDIYQTVLGYILQVLGIFLFSLGVRIRPDIFLKRNAFTVIMLAEAAVISTAMLVNHAALALSLSFIMSLLHGAVAGCYLTQLSSFVPQQYRGRVFGFGYAVGSLGSWLLTLLFGKSFLKADEIIIIFIILIAFTILLNTKVRYELQDEQYTYTQPGFSSKMLLLMFVVLVLLSMVKNIGFYFPVADFSGLISLEFSRAFYAIGLVAAGIVNDINRRIGAVCCIAALSFSFISFALNGEPGYTLVVWILGYVFFGFFSVYRVVAFSDMAVKKLLPLAAFGLMAGRTGDSLGSLAGILLSSNTISLLVVTCILFIFMIIFFFSLYQKLYSTVLSESENKKILYERFAGEYLLTAREADVFSLVIQGFSNPEISNALYIAETTVKFHVGNILKKTSSSNRTELTRLFRNKFR